MILWDTMMKVLCRPFRMTLSYGINLPYVWKLNILMKREFLVTTMRKWVLSISGEKITNEKLNRKI